MQQQKRLQQQEEELVKQQQRETQNVIEEDHRQSMRAVGIKSNSPANKDDHIFYNLIFLLII